MIGATLRSRVLTLTGQSVFCVAEKPAFSTPFGLHKCLPLPFGLFGAAAIFQHIMDKILHLHSTYDTGFLDDNPLF